VPSTTSPYLPLQVEANPFSSSSRSPLLALLFNGHQSCHRVPSSTACRAASSSALQDRVGSPSAAPRAVTEELEADAAHHLFHSHLVNDLLI
jgi:hypothetical protein